MRPSLKIIIIVVSFSLLILGIVSFVYLKNSSGNLSAVQAENNIEPHQLIINQPLNVTKPIVNLAKIESVKILSVDYFEAKLQVEVTIGERIEMGWLGAQIPEISNGYYPHKVFQGLNRIVIYIDRAKQKDIPYITKKVSFKIYNTNGHETFINQEMNLDINWPGPEYISKITKNNKINSENFSSISLIAINRLFKQSNEFKKYLLESGLPIQKIANFGDSKEICNNLSIGENIDTQTAKRITAAVLNTFTTLESVVISNSDSSENRTEVLIGGCNYVPSPFSKNTITQLKDTNISDEKFYELIGYHPKSNQEKVQEMYDQAYSLIDSGNSTNLEHAKSILDEIITIDPNFPRAYIELARYYMKASHSNFSLAEKSLLLAKEIDPNLADTRVLLGYVYSQQGRFNDAENEYILAEKLGTDNLWLYANWGLNYEVQKKNKQAIEKYQKVFSKHRSMDRNDRPRLWIYRYSKLFSILTQTEQYTLADKMYQQFIDEYPEYPCALQDHAGFLIYHLKNYNRAIDTYLKAKKNGCTQDKATLSIAYFMKWKSLKKSNAIEFDIVSALRQAEVFSPNDAELFYNLAFTDYTAEVIKDLNALGKNINTVDSQSFTALLYAVNSGKKDIVQRLLENGADINQLSGTNRVFALALAVYNNDIEMVEFLIKHKADLSLKTLNGFSVLELAKSQGNEDIVKLLSIHDRA